MNMDQCTPTSSPSASTRMSILDCPNNDNEKESMKKYPYRRLVGLLMYLSNATRPDIAHAIRTAAQFCDNPSIIHWQGIKMILRYLRGTSNYGLMFNGNLNNNNNINLNKFPIIGYADADWGGSDNRKSTSGGLITIDNNIVDWICNKQQTPSLSSCESEYIATGSTVQSMLWIDSLLKEMGIRTNKENIPLLVKNDNQSAIAICKNDVLHDRVRHIDIRHHFIRDEINNKKVEL